jgi:hypothetical protein
LLEGLDPLEERSRVTSFTPGQPQECHFERYPGIGSLAHLDKGLAQYLE